MYIVNLCRAHCLSFVCIVRVDQAAPAAITEFEALVTKKAMTQEALDTMPWARSGVAQWAKVRWVSWTH